MSQLPLVEESVVRRIAGLRCGVRLSCCGRWGAGTICLRSIGVQIGRVSLLTPWVVRPEIGPLHAFSCYSLTLRENYVGGALYIYFAVSYYHAFVMELDDLTFTSRSARTRPSLQRKAQLTTGSTGFKETYLLRALLDRKDRLPFPNE